METLNSNTGHSTQTSKSISQIFQNGENAQATAIKR
jgi:hypothetical protein